MSVEGLDLGAFGHYTQISIKNGPAVGHEFDDPLMLSRRQFLEIFSLHNLELQSPQKNQNKTDEKQEEYEKDTKFQPVDLLFPHGIYRI